jgi:hypothetical protein
MRRSLSPLSHTGPSIRSIANIAANRGREQAAVWSVFAVGHAALIDPTAVTASGKIGIRVYLGHSYHGALKLDLRPVGDLGLILAFP